MNIKTKFPVEFFAEEEKVFKVSSQTKELWAVLLDLLLEFDRVCKKHGIRYMIDGGTQLGAVRHGGFIPWDDDIDVIMLREEYEKLDKVASAEFAHPYFWQTLKTDPEHGRAFARLRNGATTMISKDELRNGRPAFRHNQGAMMDVFICDNVPDDEGARLAFLTRLNRIRVRAWTSRMSRVMPWSLGLVSRIPDFARKLWDAVCSTVGVEYYHRQMLKLDREAQQYNGRMTKYVSHITFCPDPHARMCLMVPREIFDEMTEISFEGFRFPVTKRFDEYLTIVYRDWHKFVVGDGGGGHGYVFSATKSYVEYFH